MFKRSTTSSPITIGSALVYCAVALLPAAAMAQVAAPATGTVGSPLPETPAAPAQVDRPAETTAATTAAADSGLGEITVTAQRRSQNLQNVPVAITALSATTLATANVSTINDLRLVVPSLNITNTNGILSTSLRGIGSTGVNPGFENPVATYVDGVYIASTVASFLSLSDVAQIDVLKGPQGTLFGRNATAGLIQITTRTPTQDTVLEAKIGYGNYNTVEGNLYLAGGIAKGIAADLSVYGLHQGDGFGHNLTTGFQTYQVDRNVLIRSKIAIDATPTTKIVLTGDWTTVHRNDLAGIAFPGTVNANAPAAGPTPDLGYNQIADSPTYKIGGAWGVSVKIDQGIGPLTLTSITAYRQSRFVTAFDYDATPQRYADLKYRQAEDQLSQEFRSRRNTPVNSCGCSAPITSTPTPLMIRSISTSMPPASC